MVDYGSLFQKFILAFHILLLYAFGRKERLSISLLRALNVRKKIAGPLFKVLNKFLSPIFNKE